MIHGHEVLRMMEGRSFATSDELVAAIVGKFGADARFYTCSASDLSPKELVDFLASKGKFKPTEDGFTMNREKVCAEY